MSAWREEEGEASEGEEIDLRLDEGKERGVESEGDLDLVGDLSEEELSIVDELADNETEDLSEVETGDHLLESLVKTRRERRTKSARALHLLLPKTDVAYLLVRLV